MGSLVVISYKLKIMKYKYYTLLILLTILYSCSNNNEIVLNKYNAISRIIKSNKYDSLMLELDERSISFVKFLTDTSNLDYTTIKTFATPKKLVYFSTVYNKQFGSLIREKGEKELFFLYLKLTNIPLFGNIDDLKLIEEQTISGDENYVVVGTKISDNTYITSKVNFTKNNNGVLKLDLLSLLKIRDRILYQTYLKYVASKGIIMQMSNGKRFYEKTGNEVPKDNIPSFLEDFHNLESLKEIRYNPTKNRHWFNIEIWIAIWELSIVKYKEKDELQR